MSLDFQPVKQIADLKRGDIIRHVSGGGSLVVEANYGDRVTAVITKDVTNPSEWLVLRQVEETTLA